MEMIFQSAFFLSMLRLATPLIFASLGGFFSERSGIIQLALEGLMLVGAFTAAVVALKTHSPWLGVMAGALVASGIAVLQWFFAEVIKTNQVILGTAINILAMGTIPLLCKLFFGSGAGTPSLAMESRFTFEPLLLGLLSVLFVSGWYRFTRGGLWLRFCGDNPLVLQTAGISSAYFRLKMLAASGFFAGLGGASLSIFLSSSYSNQITAGRGFIALAALIFGGWRPLPTFFVCLLFGAAEALQIQLQGQSSLLPVQVVQILPYLVTLVAIAFVGSKSLVPQALGK
jgi:ABC-type uncharacterized transport system permease subunit